MRLAAFLMTFYVIAMKEKPNISCLNGQMGGERSELHPLSVYKVTHWLKKQNARQNGPVTPS